jgi:protein gp37
MSFTAEVRVSTHRAADILSTALNGEYYKSDILTCGMFIRAMELIENEEHKKVLLNEVIDMFTNEDFDNYYMLTKRDRSFGIRLVRELNEEYVSGVWHKREAEYEKIYQKIAHRKRVIRDVKKTSE